MYFEMRKLTRVNIFKTRPGRKLGNLDNLRNLGNFFPRFLIRVFHFGSRAKSKTRK